MAASTTVAHRSASSWSASICRKICCCARGTRFSRSPTGTRGTLRSISVVLIRLKQSFVSLWPDLFRPSTSRPCAPERLEEDVDHRDEPGDDGKVGHFTRADRALPPAP